MSTQSQAGLWRFKVFDDCTGAEIKVVNAPCCRSLITPDNPDLEETEVTQLIRRDNLPLIRQLSHDTPINLLKRILNAPLKQFITHPFTKSSEPGIKYSGILGAFPLSVHSQGSWNVREWWSPYFWIGGENRTPCDVSGMRPFWANS